MGQTMPFGEVLEAADQLSPEDQETLIVILRRRLAERGRKRVLADVEEAEREFAEGGCRPVTVRDLMRDVLS